MHLPKGPGIRSGSKNWAQNFMIVKSYFWNPSQRNSEHLPALRLLLSTAILSLGPPDTAWTRLSSISAAAGLCHLIPWDPLGSHLRSLRTSLPFPCPSSRLYFSLQCFSFAFFPLYDKDGSKIRATTLATYFSLYSKKWYFPFYTLAKYMKQAQRPHLVTFRFSH